MLLPPAVRAQDPTELTVARAQGTVVDVEYENLDAREAFRRLFRAGRFGGTVAPDVRGTVTLWLRNVTWETALQNLTRQLDATYRVDHGFFEVVRRPEEPIGFVPFDAVSYGVNEVAMGQIAQAYDRLRGSVERGRTPRLEGFRTLDRRGKPDAEGRQAVRAFVAAERALPRRTILNSFLRPASEAKKGETMEVDVVYRPYGPGPARRYRDRWVSRGDGWRLASRRDANLVFKDADVQEVARTMNELYGNLSIDPRVVGRVSFDLTEGSFETFLQTLTRKTAATYRIDGGVYRIVPNERP